MRTVIAGLRHGHVQIVRVRLLLEPVGIPVGGHGLSLANEETCRANGIGVQKECQSWIGLAQTWLKKIFVYT